MTPDDLRTEIMKVRADLLRGPDAVRTAEVQAEQSEIAAEKAFDVEFLTPGLDPKETVEAKKARARLASVEAREEAVIARAAYNRAKTKVRQLETELFALQAVLKSIQIEGA